MFTFRELISENVVTHDEIKKLLCFYDFKTASWYIEPELGGEEIWRSYQKIVSYFFTEKAILKLLIMFRITLSKEIEPPYALDMPPNQFDEHLESELYSLMDSPITFALFKK